MPFLPTSQKFHLHPATEKEEPVPTTMPQSNKLKDFETVFPKLVKDLEENAKQYNMPEDNLKWYSNVSFLTSFPSHCHFNSQSHLSPMQSLYPDTKIDH